MAKQVTDWNAQIDTGDWPPVCPTPWNPLDPLPEYTRSWGPNLRRPTVLPSPDEYDTRIDPAQIFIFSKDPEKGIEDDFYVTCKPCDYCRRVQQMCTRTRPLCLRCSSDPEQRQCMCWMKEGWVTLPSPEFDVWRHKALQRRTRREAEECSSKTSPRPPTRVAPSPQQDPGPSNHKQDASSTEEQPNKRLRLSQTESIPPTRAVASSPQHDPGPSIRKPDAPNTEEQSDKHSRLSQPESVQANGFPGPNIRKPDAPSTEEQSTKRPRLSQTESIPPTRVVASNPRQDPGPSIPKLDTPSTEKLPSKRPRISQKESVSPGITPPTKANTKTSSAMHQRRRTAPLVPAPKPRRASRKLAPVKTDFPPGSWRAQDGTVWRIIRPPPSPQQPEDDAKLHERMRKSLMPAPLESPRIWASSKSDLLAVLPELSKALDANGSGIFKEDMALEPPLVFIEGVARENDKWESPGILNLTIECEFTVPPGIGQNADGVSVDYQDNDLADMTLLDGEPPSAPENATEQAQAVNSANSVACHPSELLKIRRADFRAQLSPYPSSYGSPSNNVPRSSPLSPPMRGLYAHQSQPIRPFGLTGAFAAQVPQMLRSSPNLSVTPPDIFDTHPLFTSPNGSQSGTKDCSPQCFHPNIASSEPEPVAPSHGRLVPANFNSRPHLWNRSLSSDDESEDEVLDQVASLKKVASPSSNLSLAFSPAPKSPGVREANKATRKLSRALDSHVIQALSMLPPTHRGRIALEREMNTPISRVMPRTQITKWNRPVILPADLPPEIERLEECKTYGIPVSIVVARDSHLLPFYLPEELGVVFLGFFKIQESQHKIYSSEIHLDGALTAKVRWQYKLIWIPGGDIMRDGQAQPDHPWWLAKAPLVENTEPSPYSLLPMQLSSDFAKFTGHHGLVASEVNSRLGWHCTTCGKLNVQKQLCFQQCSNCDAGNGMNAVGAMYVRDPHRMTPDSRPVDTYPDGVVCTTFDPEEDGRRTFVYKIRQKVWLKHIFTCNRSTVQKDANQLFLDLQMQVPLVWQAAKTPLAAGPYFTYLAGSGHEGNAAAAPWTGVPKCIASIRTTMESLVTQEAREAGFRIDRLTVIAWHTAGNKKGIPFAAKNTRIAMMCLGADVELTIHPVGGLGRGTNVPTTNGNPVKKDGRSIGPIDKAGLSDTSDSEDDTPLAWKRQGLIPLAASISASRATASKKRAEAMFITLVHGDVLILSGDDFEYSLHRTGMGILLFGMPSESAK